MLFKKMIKLPEEAIEKPIIEATDSKDSKPEMMIIETMKVSGRRIMIMIDSKKEVVEDTEGVVEEGHLITTEVKIISIMVEHIINLKEAEMTSQEEAEEEGEMTETENSIGIILMKEGNNS